MGSFYGNSGLSVGEAEQNEIVQSELNNIRNNKITIDLMHSKKRR